MVQRRLGELWTDAHPHPHLYKGWGGGSGASCSSNGRVSLGAHYPRVHFHTIPSAFVL